MARPSAKPERTRAPSRARPRTRTKPAEPSRSKSTLTYVVQIGGVVSTIATVIGLVFVFAPDLKPDPPSTEKGAEFDQLSADPNVSRVEYLRRIDRGPGDYTRAQLRTPGVVVGFNVSITGHKGEALPLRWAVYDAGNGHQVYREKATTLTPEAPNDEASAQVWAPLPKGAGPFYVELQLFEEDGEVVIDHARSPTFEGLAASTERAP